MKTIVKALSGSPGLYATILNTRNFRKGLKKGDLRVNYNGIDYDIIKELSIGRGDLWYLRFSDEPRFWLTEVVRGLANKPLPTNVLEYLNKYVEDRNNSNLRNLKAKQQAIINEVESIKLLKEAEPQNTSVKVRPKINWNTLNSNYINNLSEENKTILENMGIDLSSGEALQKSLNSVLGINLRVDNKIGNKTKAAVLEALNKGPLQLELVEINPISTTYQLPEISTTTEGIRPSMVTTSPINWRGAKIEDIPDYASRIRNTKYFQGGGLAPLATDRYKGATKFLYISNNDRVRLILAPRTSAFSILHPAMIEQRISSDGNDTLYAEFPEHTSLVKVKPRIAKNNWTVDYRGNKIFKNNSQEYKTLKRRFNQASGVSSVGNFTKWYFNKYQPIVSSFSNKLQ